MKEIDFIRPDLIDIVPYSSARDEFKGTASVFLDANENNLMDAYNRYPDPLQKALKVKIGLLKNIPSENLFLGNGSDEVLDLIYRLTTTFGKDQIASLNPSYGMYGVLATINGVTHKKINLDADFDISTDELLNQSNESKLLIICNPNNPTGKIWSKTKLKEIVSKTRALVIIDEAYIDFAPEESMANEVLNYPNLIVVQTLSKAFGLAGLRIGMAVCSPFWVNALNSIKPPYNISSLVQEFALRQLETVDYAETTAIVNAERKDMTSFLKDITGIQEVVESAANFILFRAESSAKLYTFLAENGIVVRDRSTQFNCANCLRITIGTPSENKEVKKFIQTFYSN